MARTLFAVDLDQKVFLDAWHSTNRQRQLAAVTQRILFSDFLRYRTRFVRSSYSFGVQVAADAEVTALVNDQLSGLTLYLLCTCIDVLTGQGEAFLDFPNWLASNRGIKDADLSVLLQSPNVNQTSSFRMLIRRLHEEYYLPRLGGRRGFAAFFAETLPVPLQGVLSSSYCVVPTTVDPGFNDDLWSEHLRSWDGLSTVDQMIRIGQYLYDYRRNPYTHAGAISLPHSGIRLDQGSSETDFISSDDVFTAFKNGKPIAVVRRFRGLPGEDEILVLRLVVAMGLRAILGVPVDSTTISRYRHMQLRREAIYYALYEIDSVMRIVDALQNVEAAVESFEGLLPVFPSMRVQKVLEYYALGSAHARSNHEYLLGYLQAVSDCNAPNVAFNCLHQHDYEQGGGSLSTWTSFVTARGLALAELRSSTAIGKLRQLAQRAYWRLNEDVDRWDW